MSAPLFVATVGSLVLQVPPAVASASITSVPVQNVVVPVIAAGAAITVIG